MAKFWVAIESKTFEVSIEEIKGKLKGIIVERSRGFSSWIRFGASGLRKLLECFEECCREEKKGRLVKVWEEEGRKFRLERRVNGAGRYVLCSVVDVEAKRFCLVFPEGKGVIGGWAILAVKLRALGIVTKKDDKGVEATQISSKKKDATIDDEEERCSGKKKQGEIRSFLDVAKGPAGRVGEELWLQVGGRGLRRREEVLGRCLVGRWEGAVMEMELDSLKNWGKRSWNLRKGVKVMKMGEPFFLLEFEDEGEAERVLNRGTRRFKDRLLHLERWNEEAGCLRDGNQTKEVWVRVVGLPLHCWSEEMFKSIGDCCGGLVGVDEATKNLSQLQWARILVKNNGNFFPGTLNLVVKSFCYAVRLWWEVQPRVSAVEPMMNLRRKEGERMREKGDEQSRAGNSGGKEKEGWRAAGADGSGAVRKRKGKEKCDGDKIGVSVEGLAGYSKKEGEVGSSEKDGVEGLDSCKCGCEVTQPSNCQRLEHESTEVWVENQKVINGSRARWEKGQSSRGGEWAAHEGPLSVKKKFLGQMDNRGEKWASRVDIPLLQRDGLGLLDNRPKVVEKDGQDDGPSSFQKDGLGRLEHRSRVAGGEGQPILASVWAPSAYKSPWDELSVNARASSCLEPAEEFFAEDSLIGGMGPAAAIGTPERCSITDECFLEEASRFKTLGAPDPHRPHEDIAFSVARFFQKGGSLQNYYMYHGGTNFGRTSGGPFITTSYDYNAPIDEYGLARLPKWGHLKELHRAIKSCEHVLLYGEPINLSLGPSQEVDVYTDSSGGCAAFISNVDEKEDKIIMFQNVSYHVPAWSVSILPDCKNVVFNTAKVGSQTSQVEMVPEELQPSLVPSNKDLKGLQWETFVEKAGIWGEADFVKNGFVDHINTTKDTTDYLWYTVSLTVGESENFLKEISQPVLLVESKGHALHAFVNQKLQGSASGNGSHSPFKFECPISLKAGKNDIALLSMTVGLQNAGPFYEWVGAGLTSVKIKGLNNGIMDLSTYTWTYKIGLQGEHLLIYKPEGLNSVKWLSTPEPPKQQPLTWYKAVVDPPSGNEPIGLDMVHMGKGLAWLNGEEIGRYWPRKSSIHDKCVQECDYRGKFMPNKCSTGCGEPTQRWYHVPRSWFKPSGNILVIFEEKGGDPTKIRFSRRKTTGVCALVSEDHPTYELESWHKDANENNKNKATIHLKCPENTHISSVKFASYGTPTGKCGSYSQGDCHDPNSASVVEKLCIRKNDCAIELAEKNFSKDLCPSTTKKLAVEAVCS